MLIFFTSVLIVNDIIYLFEEAGVGRVFSFVMIRIK